MKLTNYNITTRHGHTEVKGYKVLEGVIIHRLLREDRTQTKDNCWTLTHLPSGMAIRHFFRPAPLKDVVYLTKNALSLLDWTVNKETIAADKRYYEATKNLRNI